MKTQAAILWNVGDDWSVEEVEVAPPKHGEVLVRFVASGLCHSDDHFRTGDMPMAELPVVGGHEGAGIIEEVGPGVTLVKPGDRVVASFIPSCGVCRWCSSGHQNLCDLGALIGPGRMLDGTTRFTARGQDIRSLSMLGTFAGYGVASERAMIKIDDDIPLDRACLVGCGVTTGWGSAVHTGEVRPGQTVVVVGCGGVGGGAIQGAKVAGAANIIAIDRVATKRDMVLRLGATEFVTTTDEARELVADLTRGEMADVAILTVGVAHGEMIGDLLSLIGKDGVGVLTAMTPWQENQATIPLMEFALWQKKLKGNVFGGGNSRVDIPRLLNLYRKGLLQLDDFVTQEYKLDDINVAVKDMLDGKNIRGLIRHDHS